MKRTVSRTRRAISRRPKPTGPGSWRRRGNEFTPPVCWQHAVNLANHETGSAQPHELIQAVLETLAQGDALLGAISDETYTRKLAVAFNASVGGHYRHCLDHFPLCST